MCLAVSLNSPNAGSAMRHSIIASDNVTKYSLPPKTTKIKANRAKRGIAEAEDFRTAGLPDGPFPLPAMARCWKALVLRRRSIDDCELRWRDIS